MNRLSRLSSYTAALFVRTSHLIAGSAVHQYSPLCRGSFDCGWVQSVDLELLMMRFRVQRYSSQKASVKALRKKKSEPKPTTVMDPEKDAFFVVRKGDVIGVYKNFAECQAQIGPSIREPHISIYKGYSLPKNSEDYLVSHGLQNTLYAIRAADLKGDLFGTLVPCSFQQPDSSKGQTHLMDVTKKRSHEVLGSETVEADGSTSGLTDPMRKHVKLDKQADARALSYDSDFCILEFDGVSKGNPGTAGAGALLRTNDGSVICRLREGLGTATNSVAEYRAIILGLKYALKKGYRKIRVQGDSKLVCLQVQGLWRVRHPNLTDVYKQVKELKEKFLSFEINHVLRKFNCEADAEANLALNLADGQVQEVFE